MPQKDPAARAAYLRAWKAANRERVKELGKASYERNRDAILTRRADRRADLDDASAEERRERNRQYSAAYRQRHREDLLQRQRQRATDNPERERQYQITYRQRHRAEINERARQRYAADPDAERLHRRMATAAARVARGLTPLIIRLTDEERRARRIEASRRWRRANLERHRALVRTWHARNAEYRAAWATTNAPRRAAKNRAWQIANRERRAAMARERYRANPQKYRNLAMDYVARKRRVLQGPIDHAEIVRRDRGICQICLEPVAEADRSFDHIIPLIHDGPHTQWNLRLTHFRCNAARGPGRTPGQVYLPL
jgi:5-methylcytosine-specific restriction endonuclease McrA